MAEKQPRAERIDDPLPESVLEAIREAMRGLQFGSITLVVQDGLIIQVDRLEKNRLRRK